MTGLELFLYVLAALNVLAFGYWLRSMHFRVVVQGSSSLRGWLRRISLPRLRLDGIRSAWSNAAARFKRGTAPPAVVADGMAKWIDEVEKSETHAPAPESGSEDWWRSWADSGGLLPHTADSGRPEAREGQTP